MLHTHTHTHTYNYVECSLIYSWAGAEVCDGMVYYFVPNINTLSLGQSSAANHFLEEIYKYLNLWICSWIVLAYRPCELRQRNYIKADGKILYAPIIFKWFCDIFASSLPALHALNMSTYILLNGNDMELVQDMYIVLVYLAANDLIWIQTCTFQRRNHQTAFMRAHSSYSFLLCSLRNTKPWVHQCYAELYFSISEKSDHTIL